MGVTRRQFLSGAFVVGLGMTVTACGGGSGSDRSSSEGVSAGNGGPDELFAETASFEVVAGKPQRVMLGLSTADGRVLQGGRVDLTFQFVDDASTPQVSATAAFLPLPGSTGTFANARIGRPSEGIGVYAAPSVLLPKPGIWTIDVRKAGSRSIIAQSVVDVVEKAMVPDVGQAVPKTANPTEKSAVPREVLDSRSGPNGLGDELADPLLHQHVIDDLVAAQRPFVVVASTPVYCQSKFCGPVTDLIDAIARENNPAYADTAFVHLEVFEKFDNAAGTRLNPWVSPWIDGDGHGHEPWIFVVDRNGKVAARYDNVVDETELRAAITRVAAR